MRTAADRFWEKVEISNQCWNWTGALNSRGYGNFWNGSSYVGAHRFSWVLSHGQIPSGHCVLHSCDNTACVNPNHLWIGTQKDNMHDMIAKGRRGYTGLRGAKNPGAKLSPAEVIEIRARFSRGEIRADLAQFFNVCWSTINRIVKRKHWPHLPNPTEADRSSTTVLLPEDY